VGDLTEHGDQVRDLAGHARERGFGLVSAGPAARIEHLLAETQRAAAEGVQRVVDQIVGEAAVSHEAEHAVVVQQHGQAHVRPRLKDARRPRMAEQDLAGDQHPPAHRRLPACPGRRDVDPAHGVVDLADDLVGDAVEEGFLAGHVVIQRHRLGAEIFGEAAHGERLDAALVGDLDRGAQHALSAQREPRLGSRLCSSDHCICPPLRLDRTGSARPRSCASQPLLTCLTP